MPILTSGYWDGGLTCIKYESLVIDSTVKNLPNIPAGTKSAIVVLEKDPAFVFPTPNNICARFTEDGQTTPTAAIGMPLIDLSIYEVKESNLQTFKIIVSQGVSHSLKIQYYG